MRFCWACHARSPLGVEVSEVDGLLLAAVDAGDGAGDLAGHEGGATAGALVVEQDAVREVHAVRLSRLGQDGPSGAGGRRRGGGGLRDSGVERKCANQNVLGIKQDCAIDQKR